MTEDYSAEMEEALQEFLATPLDDRLRLPWYDGVAAEGRYLADTLTGAADEIERLQRWKAEALTVIAEWENVWEQAGRPGALGSSKALGVGFEIERLRAERTYPESPAHHRVHQGDPDTSQAAANLHPNIRSGIRSFVAQHLKAYPEGLTDAEIHALGTNTGHRHSTATRRKELVGAGYVIETDLRRPNKDGNLEVVWKWVGKPPPATVHQESLL